MKRTTAALAALCAVVIGLTGCSSDEPDEPTYYEQMRKFQAFAEFDDADLDMVGESACDLLETAVEVKGSNSAGFDTLLNSAAFQDLPEGDALFVSSLIVREHCPMDIRE